MAKLNKVLSNESAFMALGFVPMLQMFHVEIVEEDFFYSHVSEELPHYKLFANMIEVDTIDIIDFTQDFCLIVDDEGLLKSENLVYEITFQGITQQIAGRFAIGRNEYCKYKGLMTVPLQPADFVDLAELDIEIIGRVR
ncbi:hypothetical protein AAGS61_17755 [Lysinibacillus sp. KU-BSD001]|uniref:hypothetical protein n=1 Tax=Lysinibacillus sp. KU-BSD001 TaxID=3141328 RepID=UPI0036E9926A